jgi:trimethylguanosine synthase
MKNKKRKSNGKPQGSYKRQKPGRYWIEDCADSFKTDAYDLMVLITRVELTDHHQEDQKVTASTTTSETTTKVTPKAEVSATKTLVEVPEKGEEDAREATLELPKKGEMTDGHHLENMKDQKVTASATTSATATGVTPTTEGFAPKTLVEVPQKGEEDAREATQELPKMGETVKQVEKDADEETAPESSKAQKLPAKGNGNPFVCIRRDPSAKGAPAKYYQDANFKLLPRGDCGDGIVNPHPKAEVADKYWAQRKRLFVKYDQGIQLDREGWYSVTPEAIANHIARRMVAGAGNGMVVLDACAGVGGNVIAFARRPEVSLVVCVDTDDARLRIAANNCSVYGIPRDKVVFVNADACQVLASYKNGKRIADVESSKTVEKETEKEYAYSSGLDLLPETLDAVFLSPPWGGSDYESVGRRNYDLSCIKLSESVDGEELLRLSAVAVPEERMNVAYFLPRNTNGVRYSYSALKTGFSGCLELEQNVLNGKLKTITAYLGALPASTSTQGLLA